MATREIVICDHCGEEVRGVDPKAIALSVFVDRKMDAAGSMGDEYETVHLCHACLVGAMNDLLDGRNPRIRGGEWLREWAAKRYS